MSSVPKRGGRGASFSATEISSVRLLTGLRIAMCLRTRSRSFRAKPDGAQPPLPGMEALEHALQRSAAGPQGRELA